MRNSQPSKSRIQNPAVLSSTVFVLCSLCLPSLPPSSLFHINVSPHALMRLREIRRVFSSMGLGVRSLSCKVDGLERDCSGNRSGFGEGMFVWSVGCQRVRSFLCTAVIFFGLGGCGEERGLLVSLLFYFFSTLTFWLSQERPSKMPG